MPNWRVDIRVVRTSRAVGHDIKLARELIRALDPFTKSVSPHRSLTRVVLRMMEQEDNVHTPHWNNSFEGYRLVRQRG